MLTFCKEITTSHLLSQKRVAEVCVLTTNLYGFETRCYSDYGKLDGRYMGIVKALLAVRKTTCNDLCLVEDDMTSLKAAIRKRQQKYFSEKLTTLHEESPLKFALNLVESVHTPSYRLIRSIQKESNIITKDRHRLSELIRGKSGSTNRITYVNMNPSLTCSTIYQNSSIDEYKRIEFTRTRLSSYN